MNRRKASISLYLILFLLVMIIVLFTCKSFAYAGESANSGKMKCYRSVTIYSGDTLPAIADKNIPPEYSDNASYIKEIAFINHINENEALIPGNHLIIPYYTAAN